MKRLIYRSVGLLLIPTSMLFTIGRFLPTRAAAEVTNICGTISANATWSAAASPYEICMGGATIAADVTLNIEPGVTVQFQSNARLTARGILAAAGTPTQPITLTGVNATPGSWAGVLADNSGPAPAMVRLDFVTIEFGGINNSTTGQLYVDRASLQLTNSVIRNSAGNGIYATSQANLDLNDTIFTNNGGQALRLIQPITGLRMSALTAIGNSLNAVYVGGSTYLRGQRSWPSPGIPYVIDGVLGNYSGDSLSIDPGAELQFTTNGWLNIQGELKAIGFPGQPITLTGQIRTPGTWNGLVVYGGLAPANAQLHYVTIEYGGRSLNGADISVDAGNIIARNSIVRFSLRDGIRINSKGQGAILNSQIVSNTAYGIRNTRISRPVLATNNWWGDASGPTSDIAGCSQGAGDKVTAAVIFRPVLTDTNSVAPFPLSDSPAIQLTPRRWFAPADGLTRVYFDIQVRDGNGTPLPGRTVRIGTSLGTVTDGGITDQTGKTLAYLVSNSVGDAEVTAALDALDSCEGAMSPGAKVTFTTPVNTIDLFPDSPAPYFNTSVSFSPLPIVVAVPSTINATLKNPLDVPVTVDVSIGFATSGIGLAFGPIKDFLGQVIPANGSLFLSAPWLPIVSGHYCFELVYTVTAVGSVNANSPGAVDAFILPFNGDSEPAGLAGPREKPTLDKTRKALNAMNFYFGRAFNTNPFAIPLYLGQYGIQTMLSFAEQIAEDLAGDPPRQDFNAIAVPPRPLIVAAQPPAGVTAAEAQALDALANALADVVYSGKAATISIDRNGGAAQASNLAWATVQANATIYHKEKMGEALAAAAGKIDDFYNLLVSEGKPDNPTTIADVIAYQAALKTNGFDATEIGFFHAAGSTNAQIESLRQQRIAADPTLVAGSPRSHLLDLSAHFRQLSDILLHPYGFSPGFSVGGGAGLRLEGTSASPSGNDMVQLYQSTATLLVGNPGASTATIDIVPRFIDLPPDWSVSVTPAQASLAPGEQVTVTVQIFSGSPVPQGSTSRIAVEGYSGGQLISGVVIDVVAPRYLPFDGFLHTYLPTIVRR